MTRSYRVKVSAAALVSMGLIGKACAFTQPIAPRASLSDSTQPLFMQRREAIHTFTSAVLGAGTFIGSTHEANALDMDSFEKSLIDKDTSECDPKLDRKCQPKLTADEAQCMYGVSGSDSRGEACRRVRDAGGLLPGAKKGERNVKGWVDNPIAL